MMCVDEDLRNYCNEKGLRRKANFTALFLLLKYRKSKVIILSGLLVTRCSSLMILYP